MSYALALPPASVDEHAKDLEEAWRTLDLVEDDELPFVHREIILGICEPSQITWALQIEVDRSSNCLLCERERQGGLSYLPRP